ncbi:GGDEF domain-containing protein [Sporolactobacillus shoreicorticis]|uniref:GGDEF domain-containing protein n=1 Tax=Sporolactobacillus shoreicorticis TaxID=1923877 RepID=A0ABW5S400_9BACL|nr:GGDEF domain-containing protein [Sporolactobacillus shoreicorticis]MCO7124409.1 GGDEF domain-containing protein [Sporolactobacillus shoreicorticis]
MRISVTNNQVQSVHSNSDSDRKFSIFCNNMFLFACVAHIVFIPIFYFLGNPVTFINNILAVMLDLVCFVLNRRGYARTASFIWICEIALHSVFCILILGWDQGYYYYFLALVPIVFFARWSISLRFIVIFFLFTVTLFLFYYTQMYPPMTKTNSYMTQFMYISSVTANFVGLAYAAYYYRRHSEQMEAKLSKLAHTDALTGILNRRAFELAAQNELKQHIIHKGKCALMFFDIDHFKRVNDLHGHAVGDRALQHVARLCLRVIGDQDLLGRIGGEEFVVFLVRTGHSRAVRVAETIRESIEAEKIMLDDGSEVLLTASIGVALLKSSSDALPQLMIRADQALYQAKTDGRNCVVCVD